MQGYTDGEKNEGEKAMENRGNEAPEKAKERMIQETIRYLFGLDIKELDTVRKVAKNLYYLDR